MKKINIITARLVIASLLMVVSSCSGYLDKEPLSDYLSSNFYNNEEAIKQGTNGVYQGLYMESNTIPFLVMYDMYTGFGIERADNSSIGVGDKDLKTLATNETQWAKFYEGVARCNTVLDGAAPFYGGLNDKAKQYLAEIKVIRALHYHYLVSFYGDVPFFTASVTEQERTSANRKPWKDIVEQLFIDLDDAALLLPWQAGQMGRIDKSFALGLKARIALYAGSWCKEGFGLQAIKDPEQATAYFKIAAEASKAVMEQSGRKLSPDFAGLFTRVGQMTANSKSENIFALMYSDQSSKKTHYLSFGEHCRMIGQSGRFPTQLLVDSYEMRNGKRIDEPGSGYNPQKPFESRDPRLKQTVYTHHDTIIGNPGGSPMKFLMELFNPVTQSFNAAGTMIPLDNKDYAGAVAQYGYVQSGVGYLWKKYNHFTDEASSQATYNILMMRYAEVLLTYAEAKIELNELEASVYSAINEVRARVGMPDILSVDPSRNGNQAKMRQIVRRERKVELARESLHFFDMRRWRIGALENAEPTYGFPLAIGVDADNGIYPDGYTQATPDMVPSYGAAGSNRDLNDLALYAAYGSKLRKRDVDRPKHWNDMYYLWPIPQTERNKCPWLTQNDGYGQ